MSQSERNLVLVVEDEFLIRMMLAEELEDVGLATIEAGDASEALSLLEAHPDVAVLFTDINMPGSMNGIELARGVQARRPDIKCILASGRERPTGGAMADEWGFVSKPFSPIDVAQLIREAVS